MEPDAVVSAGHGLGRVKIPGRGSDPGLGGQGDPAAGENLFRAVVQYGKQIRHQGADKLQLQMIGSKGIRPKFHFCCQAELSSFDGLHIHIGKQMLAAVKLRNHKFCGIDFRVVKLSV